MYFKNIKLLQVSGLAGPSSGSALFVVEKNRH